MEYYSKNYDNDKSKLNSSEVDFICNMFDKRYYIQVAYSMPSIEKLEQEQKSLIHIKDSFKKIIIAKDVSRSHYNENGIYILNLFDFLLNENSLEL